MKYDEPLNPLQIAFFSLVGKLSHSNLITAKGEEGRHNGTLILHIYTV